MSKLNLDANFSDGDAFYASLTDLHRDAEAEMSERINARLILLLANHIGDINILNEALEIAGAVKGEQETDL